MVTQAKCWKRQNAENIVQCPLDITAMLPIAPSSLMDLCQYMNSDCAVCIATSTPMTEASRCIQCTSVVTSNTWYPFFVYCQPTIGGLTVVVTGILNGRSLDFEKLCSEELPLPCAGQEYPHTVVNALAFQRLPLQLQLVIQPLLACKQKTIAVNLYTTFFSLLSITLNIIGSKFTLIVVTLCSLISVPHGIRVPHPRIANYSKSTTGIKSTSIQILITGTIAVFYCGTIA